MKKIKTLNIKLGKVRDDILPEGFIFRVQKYKEILREVETSSLEEAINNFQRDLHPENELIIWEHIANCYATIMQDNVDRTMAEKKKIFREILISTMK